MIYTGLGGKKKGWRGGVGGGSGVEGGGRREEATSFEGLPV